MWLRSALWVVLPLLFVSMAFAQSPTAKVAWLRGTGDSLEIRIRGELLNAEGKPAPQAKITARVDSDEEITELAVTRNEHRFETWIPVGKLNWFSLYLDSESEDGKLSAAKLISFSQLRQFAKNGVKLSLRPLDRVVDVKVIHKGATVKGANVRARSQLRRDIRAVTDDQGVARIGMAADDRFYNLTSWTADHRIGGFGFNSRPKRDPKATFYIIDLSNCRPQKIRFINTEDQTPIGGMRFLIQVATPAPQYEYVGAIPESTMIANAKGEATFEWFPDWPAHHYYVDHDDPAWVDDGQETVDSDGVLIVPLKRSRKDTRKPVTGEVTSVDGIQGGFCVSLRSFGGESEDRSDVLFGFTDAEGKYTLPVLPGAMYHAAVHDEALVAAMTHGILYDPEKDKVDPPKLSLVEGTPVVISVTEGPNRKPIAGINISMRATHYYTWKENGEQRAGEGSRDWWGKSNEKGLWQTIAHPDDPLEINIREPEWELEKEAKVIAGTVNRIELHRDFLIKQKVPGQVVLGAKAGAKLAGAEVSLTALDKISTDQQKVKVGEDGAFEFETEAKAFGLYAFSADGSAAGGYFVEGAEPAPPHSLVLEPTAEYQGRLVDENGAPLVNQPLNATLRIFPRSEALTARGGPQFFDIKTMTAKTDRDGNFTIRGTPPGVTLQVYTASTLAMEGTYAFDTLLKREVFAARNETTVFTPLKSRLNSAKRDAALGGFHVMVLGHPANSVARDFVASNLYNYDEVKEVGDFLHVFHRVDDDHRLREDRVFAKSLNWPDPKSEQVFAVALDAKGKELGRVVLDINEVASIEKAATFVRKHAPKKQNAQQKWDEAFALAKRTKRKVWVRAAEPFNPACALLSRWLDQNKGVIEKDFVLVQVDVTRDVGGEEMLKRLAGEKADGFPLQVIFDAGGGRVIDSRAAAGNIGFPQGADGAAHLRKMLMTAREQLSDAEADKLVKSLTE